MVRLPRTTLMRNMMGLGNTMRLRSSDLCQVQQGSGSREIHGTCREMQANASLMLVEDTPRYQHPEYRISICSMISIGTFFDRVRHGRADACAASASTRLTAAPEGAVQAMVAGYAPRRRVPGYINSSFNCGSAANWSTSSGICVATWHRWFEP